MKEFFSEIRGAVVSPRLVLAVVCCGLYPLVVFGISQAVFHDKANGSLIVDADGTVRGSKLLGQEFADEKYFHPRPSAAGNGYDAASSGGSNLGPTSQKLNDAIKDRIAAYRKENGLNETEPVPADAVTASGSGLDPHISLRNAELQIPRVAKARGVERRESARADPAKHRRPRSRRFRGARRECSSTESCARSAALMKRIKTMRVRLRSDLHRNCSNSGADNRRWLFASQDRHLQDRREATSEHSAVLDLVH